MNKHFNLIKSDLYRLFKEKSFYIILSILVVITILNVRANGVVELYEIMGLTDVGIYVIVNIFSTGNFLTFLVIQLVIFLTVDYKFNTIRNKIIAGNSKLKIYLSSFATSVIIMIIYFFITFIASFIACGIWVQEVSIFDVLAPLFALILQYIAIIAILTATVFIFKSRTTCMLANILPLFLTTIVLLLLLLFTQQSELFYTILCLNPYTMVSLISSQFSISSDMVLSLETMLESIFVCIGYVISFSAIGYLVFCKVDIK